MIAPALLPMQVKGVPAVIQKGDRLSQRVTHAYRDTPASAMERVLSQIRAGQPWRNAVRDEYAVSHRWLYDIVTHPNRTRFLELYRPRAGALVLDVGAGWGQTTLPLAATNPVVALEPTPERLDFIQAAAEQEGVRQHIYFVEASMMDIEFGPIFDYITCIGVLEWVAKFDRRHDPRTVQLDFLRRLRSSLIPGGRCCLGIENRLGLKYLLGARDDHTGQTNISVLDATLAAVRHQALTGEELRVFTYSLTEYRTLFREAGFRRIETHASFPDYKLPDLIVSIDDPATLNGQILSQVLPPEHDGVDGHRLPNQDELQSHYRSLAEMGLAHVFAPSFFFLLE